MPALLVPLLLAALKIALIWIITRLIVGFGIGFVTYKVSDYVFNWIVDVIDSSLSMLDAPISELIMLSGFTQFLNIILSAYSAAFAIKWAKKTLTFGLNL